MELEQLREQQGDLYTKIAEAKGDELDALLDAVWAIDAKIEEIENPRTPPLSIEEFESQYDVRREHERFHDEYGDAVAFYSDYLQYHYDTYLSFHKKGIYFSF